MDEKNLALEAIRKKLIGKTLTYKEIYAIMDQISDSRLGDILTTYFVASGYSKGFTNDEIYYLTRAMVETGEKLHFDGIVADKHSIGGVPGTRTTLIVVPIIAAAGFRIPKSSSRAITTPAGTADVMEVLANVTFRKQQIYKIIERANGCIVWGGSFKIAPADDEIIRIEEPLLFESFDKILVSVMAKKIAFGATHVVIDIPFGETVKVRKHKDAEVLASKFKYLAKKFDIKMNVLVEKADQPAGYGIGPVLEAKDALQVLEQGKDRPLELEERAIALASNLLKLCLRDLPPHDSPLSLAKYLLTSGKALDVFKKIIEAQGGNPEVSSHTLKAGNNIKEVKSKRKGVIKSINNKDVSIVARILGAPEEKRAGIFLHKRVGDIVSISDTLCLLHSTSSYRAQEAFESLSMFPIYNISS